MEGSCTFASQCCGKRSSSLAMLECGQEQDCLWRLVRHDMNKDMNKDLDSTS